MVSVCGLPARQLKLINRFVRNRGSNDRASNIDADVCGCLTFLNFYDLALQNVACASGKSPVAPLLSCSIKFTEIFLALRPEKKFCQHAWLAYRYIAIVT
jgi:hypothetical protein